MLGRFNEALDPLASELQIEIKNEQWWWIARTVDNLVAVKTAIGLINEAEDLVNNIHSTKIEHEHDEINRHIKFNLAYILYLRGQYEDSLRIYDDLSLAPIEGPFLRAFTIQQYRYCDLLLEVGLIDRGFRQIKSLLDIGRTDKVSLEIALGLVHLAKAYRLNGDFEKASRYLNEGIGIIRSFAGLEHLPGAIGERASLSLIAGDYRTARADLDTVMRIARRSGMRLYECDAHLDYTRLAIAEGKPGAALPHFKSAQALVTACGYHRRDLEIAELKEKLGL